MTLFGMRLHLFRDNKVLKVTCFEDAEDFYSEIIPLNRYNVIYNYLKSEGFIEEDENLFVVYSDNGD